MVFPTFFNLILNFAIRSSWSESQSCFCWLYRTSMCCIFTSSTYFVSHASPSPWLSFIVDTCWRFSFTFYGHLLIHFPIQCVFRLFSPLVIVVGLCTISDSEVIFHLFWDDAIPEKNAFKELMDWNIFRWIIFSFVCFCSQNMYVCSDGVL